jgi:hypothetical protein
VKDELIAQLGEDSQVDGYVKEKVNAALKACKSKIDAEFYELESLFAEEKEPEVVVQNEEI